MAVQMTIGFFLIVIISSVTGEVKKNLTGTEGGSITLPDAVAVHGFLLLGGKNIAMLSEKKINIYEEIYKDRVLWNSSTGLFTITGLQTADSGIYDIDSKDGTGFITSYKLTVYESVPTPAVNTLSVSTESCTFLCFVEKANNQVTLLWYKDKEILNQSSSALPLPLTVHKQDFNSSYRCVAANPAEEKTLPVSVVTSCGGQHNIDDRERHYMAMVVIPIVAAVTVILAAFIIKRMYFDKIKRTSRHTQDSVNTEPEVQYTDVHISEGSCSQGGHLPDSSGPVYCSNLTTVYDKLEAHRLVQAQHDSYRHC